MHNFQGLFVPNVGLKTKSRFRVICWNRQMSMSDAVRELIDRVISGEVELKGDSHEQEENKENAERSGKKERHPGGEKGKVSSSRDDNS